METLTLGDLATALAFLVALGGSIWAIVKSIKKALTAMFKEQTAEITRRMDRQEDTIKKIDMENCKNFLVSYLAKVKNGEHQDPIERLRFGEEFDHYVNGGGNSYIRDEVTRLRTEGKI